MINVARVLGKGEQDYIPMIRHNNSIMPRD